MPSNYGVVGFVLKTRFAKDIIGRQRSEFLRRCASFLELVCTDGDLEAINLVWIELFEWLIFRPKELNFIWPILGEKTKVNIKDAAQRWSAAARQSGSATENLPERNIPKQTTDLLM